jgi:hypothetical protein
MSMATKLYPAPTQHLLLFLGTLGERGEGVGNGVETERQRKEFESGLVRLYSLSCTVDRGIWLGPAVLTLCVFESLPSSFWRDGVSA